MEEGQIPPLSFMDKLNIGGIPLTGHVVLGPMAGVTSLAYREFMKPFGVALSYSEMISDCGLSYHNKKTLDYAKTSHIDRPVGLQLFGFDIRNTAQAIEILEAHADYDILDLNFGCPVQKVTKTGAGSAWMKRPLDLYQYVRMVVTKSHKPVTAKLRLGWDSTHINIQEIAPALEEAGVKMITVHARTAVQAYSGKPDFNQIAHLGSKLSIPLCVSGDIFTPEDALNAMKIADASLVMVARGGLGNPELVTNIENAIEGKPCLPPPSIAKDAEYALRFSQMLCEEKGEHEAVLILRGLLPHFFTGFPGYKKIRAELSVNPHSFTDLQKLLLGIRDRNHL